MNGVHKSYGVGVVASVSQRNFDDDTIHSIKVVMERVKGDGSSYDYFHTVEMRNSTAVPDVGDEVYFDGDPSVRTYVGTDGVTRAAFCTRGYVRVLVSGVAPNGA